MKTATFMKIAATLAIGAAFPLGAMASPQTKTTASQGVVQKVKKAKGKAPEAKAPEAKPPAAKPPRKHFFAQPWMES
jgi:hypothetical protein